LVREPVVVRFASRQAKPNWQAIGIDHCMYLAGQAASGPAHGLPSVSSDAGAMLMHADNRRVDHLHRRIMGNGHDRGDQARPVFMEPIEGALSYGSPVLN
jgi:hypothetical protein